MLFLNYFMKTNKKTNFLNCKKEQNMKLMTSNEKVYAEFSRFRKVISCYLTLKVIFII